mgnify:CR=1 FL=1
MVRIKTKQGSGIYERNPIYNTYIDCGDYYEIVIEDRHGREKCRAKIDKDDLEKVKTGKWSYAKSVGYALRIINNKTTLLHWIILGRKKGYISDHINGNRLDNRKANLRHVTVQQNACNRAKMRGVYISTYYKNKKQKKWVAHIIYKGRFHYLGIFDNESDALNARSKAEVKYFGDHRRKLDSMTP